MENRLLKTGAAVPSLQVGNVPYNCDVITTMMQENKDCGVLVFPELCITGYTCADLFNQSLLLQQAIEGLFVIAKASGNILNQTVVVGVPLQYGNQLYNCAAFISEGKICGIVPKINIPTYSEFYEGRWFASGKGIVNTSIVLKGHNIPFGVDLLFDNGSGVIIGTEICEDLWVMDKPGNHACMAGANILVNPSASDEVIGKYAYRRNLVSAHSGDCYCGYIYSSAGNDESSTDLVFSGHCMIAESGKILNECIYPQRNHVITALLDVERLNHDRIHQNTCINTDIPYTHVSVSVGYAGGNKLNPSQLADLLKRENRVPSRMPFVPENDEELAQRCRSILQIQAQGLATRVRSTGITTLVIGISGGLDSTLALLVCNEARKLVPEIRIIAITMPNLGNTTSLTYNNAISLMKLLNTEIREVEIGKGVAAHLADIGHSGAYQGEGDIAYENAQARMRTYILMDTANMENGLVVGTGDLSELALGWCTYNGDHMSMYGVNASVPKTLVQYICRAYALTCGNDELKNTLLSIVDTPISPELTPNKDGAIAQKTEDKIGKYDLNDFFLYWMMRYGMEPEKILGMAMAAYEEVDENTIREALKRFYNRFFHQQFKRSCLPDGPKVGSVTLSPRGDWRMPSDASVAMWIRQLG